MEDIPEKEVSDMSFVHVFNARIGSAIDKNILNRSNLIAASNKYGVIFAANNKTLQVMTMAFLDEQISKMSKLSSMRKMVDNMSATAVELGGDISQIYVNSTEDFLAVCTSKNGFVFAAIYDIKVFAQESASAFTEIKLTSSTDEYLLDFSWNPGSADLSKTFIVCTSSGSASVFEVHPNEIKQLGVLKPSNQIAPSTCACWSPKGKQVAVGNESGEVTLYLPQMTPKNVIPACPGIKEKFGDVKVLDILWETASSFFIVYKSKTANSEPQLVYMKTQNNQPTFTFYGDVCFGSSETENSRYQFNLIRQWNLLLVSSATSSEMCMMMKDKDVWYKCDMEEKPEVFSLGDDYQTYCPRGVCFVFGSGHQWKVKGSDSMMNVVSLPTLVMSNDGCLSLVQFVTRNPEHLSLNVTPQPLYAEGALRSAQPAVIGQPKAPSVVQTVPTFEQPPPKTNLPSFAFSNMMTQQVKTTVQSEVPKNAAINIINNPQISENLIGQSFGQSNLSTNRVSLNLLSNQSTGEPARKSAQFKVEGQAPKVATSEVSLDATDGQVDPFVERINEEVKHFSKEVKDVLMKFSAFKIDKNFTNELNSLTANSKTLIALKDELCSQVVDMKKDIEEQKTEMLELFATMERCRATHERNNDPKYLALLRQRPLDPSKKSKMAEIEAALGYVGMEILKIDAVLDSNWQDYLDEQKRQRFIQPPNLHIIYETLCSNRIIIGKIKNTLDYYKKKINSDPKLNKTSILNLTEMFASSCNVASKSKEQMKIRRDKEAQLREFLLNRKVVTVHSTAPENLRCSKIISTYQKREIEVTKNEKQQSPRASLNRQPQAESQQVKVQLGKTTQIPSHSFKLDVVQQHSLKVDQHVKEEVKGLNSKESEQPNILPSINILTSSKPFLASTTLASTTITGSSFSSKLATFPKFDNASATTTTVKTPFSLSVSKPSDFVDAVKPSQTTSSNVPSSAPSRPSFGFSSFKPMFPNASENNSATFTGFQLTTSLNKKSEEEKKTEEYKIAHPSSPLKMLKQMNADLEKQSQKEPKIDASKPSVSDLFGSLKARKSNVYGAQSDDEEESGDFPSSVLPPAANDNSKSCKDAPILIKDSVKQELAPEFLKKEMKSTVVSQPGLSFNVSSSSGFGLFEQNPTDHSTAKTKKLPEYEPKVSESSKESSVDKIAATSSQSLFGTSNQSELFVKASVPDSKPNVISLDSSVAKTSTLSGFGIQSMSSSIFGSGGNVTQSSLFGSSSSTSEVGATKPVLVASTISISSIFGTPSTAATSVFGSSSASATSVFGASSTTSTTSILGTPTTSAAAFGSTTTSVAPAFGSSTTSAASVFGAPSASATSVFGASSTTSVFGASSTTSTTSIFGTPTTSAAAFGSTTTSVAPAFGSSTTSVASVFGASTTSAAAFVSSTSSTRSIFGTSSTSTTSAFGTPTASIAPIFGVPTTTVSKSTSVFGAPSASTAPAFGAPSASTAPAFGDPSASTAPAFGASNTSATPAFGASNTSATPAFGASNTSTTPAFGASNTFATPFGAPNTSTPLFGAPSNNNTSLFGAPNNSTPVFGAPSTSTSIFGAPSSTPSVFGASGTAPAFGSPGFSNRTAPAFGASPQSPLGFATSASPSTFGASNASVFGTSTFNNSSTPAFGQSSTFGQNSGTDSGGLFGTFGGLGGKPSEEKASKNVFGSTTFGSSGQSNSIFGQPQTNTVFGSVKTEANIQGSFSDNIGNVGAAGFGGFQKPQGSAFGASASFGGTPAFGSPGNMSGAFGAPPAFGAFGAAPSMGTSMDMQGNLFGSGDRSGFASAPSFEGMKSSGPDFGNLAQQGGFGSFGGEQSAAFGSNSFQPKSPQFTQFRS